MKKTFEDFLMDKHAEQYCGTDDLMVDDYNDWIVAEGIDEIIEYANQFFAQQKQKIEKAVEKAKKSRIWELVPNTPRKIMAGDKEVDKLFSDILKEIEDL